jgi:hypothetical protein
MPAQAGHCEDTPGTMGRSSQGQRGRALLLRLADRQVRSTDVIDPRGNSASLLVRPENVEAIRAQGGPAGTGAVRRQGHGAGRSSATQSAKRPCPPETETHELGEEDGIGVI